MASGPSPGARGPRTPPPRTVHRGRTSVGCQGDRRRRREPPEGRVVRREVAARCMAEQGPVGGRGDRHPRANGGRRLPAGRSAVGFSEQERASLSRIVDPRRICVVPNAVAVPLDRPPVGEVTAVSFLGWYGYPPNEAAALELMRSIMPAIRSAGGPRPLVLIGAQPTDAMVRVAAGTGDVSLTGQVADVVPALRAAGILVVPVRAGGGTRVKILGGHGGRGTGGLDAPGDRRSGADSRRACAGRRDPNRVCRAGCRDRCRPPFA